MLNAPFASLAAVLYLFTSLAGAAPSPPSSSRTSLNLVKESINSPRGWVQGPPAPEHHMIKLSIALPQPRFGELETHLQEVSDPAHARYGQHLSKADVDALVTPHQDSLDTVDAWLAEHGLSDEDMVRSDGMDWVTIRVTIGTAERMLDTKYHIWIHEESGDVVVRTLSYSLPESLHEHVELVQPTTMFARFKPEMASLHYFPSLSDAIKPLPSTLASVLGSKVPSAINAVNASCNSVITLDCLQDLYGTKGYQPRAADKNAIGITGYLEQFANIQDLKQFYAEQLPEAINSSFTFVSVADGQNSQNASQAGIEANLDTQYGLGLSFPTPGTFWSTAGRPPFNVTLTTPTDTNEPYNTWLDFVLGQQNLPQTISTSYGDEEQSVPLSYAIRACNSFAQLGLRGVSVIFSSGDGGVGDGDTDPATTTCKSIDGQDRTEFLPFFPASCPYVTAVGGTVNVAPEIGVFFSGGGFSNYFERPAYQKTAVEGYLAGLGDTYAGLFNSSGRAYPDVSAQSMNFSVVVGGRNGLVSGTSAAAPTFAAIVSLLNDVRLASNKPSLGFLNPFLYAKGIEGLTDILTGNNPGCGTQGFNASKGWDPVTGLGTPKFEVLKTLI